MVIARELDELGRPAWIALMVLAFVIFWPAGLALLAYLKWSGRMGCGHHGFGRWQRWERFQERHEARRAWAAQNCWGASRSSGNRAFDEYRTETLRRLEDEEREFREFLDRLRFAKDKAEFDQFLTERRTRTDRPEQPETPQA